MGEAFGQSISPVDVIKSILRQYAFGVGFFREILQNSDDAKAAEQEFILDRRRHSPPDETAKFASGPALVAYNNGLLTDADWTGLQTINSSSKKTDTTKTGKYGSGFRSTFHLTDTPEILSGPYLAFFDPLTLFHAAGGVRHNFLETDEPLSDHLQTYASVCTPETRNPFFHGTAIRLPLRTHDSEGLQAKAISADEIKQIMLDFIHGELGIVMLFLRSVSSIVLKDISATGGVVTLATARVDRSHGVIDGDFTTYKAVVTVDVPGAGATVRTWRILETVDSISDYAKVLDEKLRYTTSNILAREKMTPQVGLAAPLDGVGDSGRLFTFLPLPISTGYPCSINGIFALTVDRQHLLNPEEQVAERSHDKLRIEWNKLVFSKTIPTAWSALLRALIQHDLQDNATDIYRFWPRVSMDTPRGETKYWNQVPVDLAESVSKSASKVWPLVDGNWSKGPPVALTTDVLVVSESADAKFVDAIATAGVRVLHVPPHVLSLLERSAVSFTPMTPESVHLRLLDNVGRLTKLASSGQGRVLNDILIYLLSTDSISNAFGLPILPTTGEGYVSISNRHSSLTSRTLLDVEETNLFGPLDPSAISLTSLPPNFRRLSLSETNIHLLTSSDVARYVTNALEFYAIRSLYIPPNFGPDHPGYVWLQSFWTWLSARPEPLRMEVFQNIRGMATLPTAAGGLCAPVEGIYAYDDVEVGLRRLLERSGFSFLHSRFSLIKLSPFGFTQSISNLPRLIECIQPNVLVMASDVELDLFRQLLERLLQRSSPLNEGTRSRLRLMPIFPILPPGIQSPIHHRGTISSYRILLVRLNSLLPTVPGVCYVADSSFGVALVRAIDNTISLCGEADLASLFVDHLIEQPATLQAAFIKHVRARRGFIPNNTIIRLGQVRFVSVGTGWEFARPVDVVHPDSEMARNLLRPDDPRFPVLSTQAQRDIVSDLAGLGFLISGLTPTIATECIARISSKVTSSETVNLATRLLNLMDRTALRYQEVQFTHDQSWIPVEGGALCSPDRCRDDGIEAHRSRKLFDHALSVVAIRVQSCQLRARLRWDSAVPLSILEKQFAACAQEEPIRVDYIKALINEFGARFEELTEGDVQWLRTAADNREWIPTRDSGCVQSAYAVFRLGANMPPFREVALVNTGARKFLRAMGCSEAPSTQGVIRALESLSPPLDIRNVLRLLEALKVDTLTTDEMNKVLVPGDDGSLHPREHVYYNDLGSKAYLVNLPPDCSRTHLYISAGLAAALKLKDLSSLELHDEDEDEDMGEALPTRIDGALRQYREEQILTEFLANAVDAGAKNVHMVVDERDFSDHKAHLLTKEMEQFQSSPALVIYNDSVFTEDDFRGIRRVGEGSKRSKSGKIGRFGLGALAAYHLSEVVWIVSGKYALILDPSKKYLVSRASRKIKLQDMKRLFPDQLASLEGLHDFSSSSDYYPGTLFRLPLRSRTQALSSQLTARNVEAADALAIVWSYEYQARLSTLFVSVEAVCASRRLATSDAIEPMWSIEASRMTITSCDRASPRIVHEEVKIIPGGRQENGETWRKGTLRLQRSDVPPIYQMVLNKSLVPDELSVGVAFFVSKSPPISQLFSHLPLPIKTYLPAHVHASFILAEDRRSIRFDETSDEQSESSFNKWLLTTSIPDIYLSVLHHWPQSSASSDDLYSLADKRFWPQEPADKISKTITTELFQRLGQDTRLVCENSSGVRIPPRDAFFIDGYVSGRDVRSALESIAPRNLVCAPRTLKDTTVCQVDQAYVQNTIRALKKEFIHQFNDKHITVAMVMNVVLYLLAGEPEVELKDLPLLPLADGTLHSFSRKDNGLLPSICWKMGIYESPPWAWVFPWNRFVHPEVNGTYGVKLVDRNLNVVLLDDQVIGELTRSQIGEADDRTLSVEDAKWLRSHFWEHFDAFHSFEDIGGGLRALPLIPVLDPSGRRFISYDRCHCDSVFSVPTDSSLVSALTTMGALLIDKNSLAPSLRRRLDCVEFSVQKVIDFLDSARSAFARMTATDKSRFTSWITREFEVNMLSPAQISIARTLPLWSALSPAGGRPYVAADYVLMLPLFVSLDDAIRFLGPGNYVAFNSVLHTQFKKEPMSVSDVHRRLVISLGSSIKSDDLPSLASLLRAFVGRLESRNIGPWIVPNAIGVYTPIDQLFSRNNDLFVAAFHARRPAAFIHQSLSSLDPDLKTLGLQVEVTHRAFLECALAIQTAEDPERFDGASAVYNYYRDQLPFQRNMQWYEAQDIRFIHRAEDRRWEMPAFNQYALELPDIVAPSQLVRKKYEAVAWTQRARFRLQPSDRLLAEHKILGVPSVGDVINHLRSLREVARENFYNRALISDFKATYDFLQNHIDEVRPAAFNREPRDIFLNVDEPLAEWQWVAPRTLIVNAEVDGPDYQKVRKFLEPYGELIVKLGGDRVENVATPNVPESEPEEILRVLRAGFDTKRREDIDIDVIFVDGNSGRHPAHRIYLAALVPHFNGQFYASGMRESIVLGSGPAEVTVPSEYDGRSVAYILDFLYTGLSPQVPFSEVQVLLDVLGLANYWGLEHLKEITERNLVAHLSPATYRDIRVYAERHEAETLLQSCQEYARKNERALNRGVSL